MRIIEIRHHLLALLILSYSYSFSQTVAKLPKGAVQFNTEQMKWIDGPPSLPKGSKMCILYGDVKKDEPFAIRVRLPAEASIKMHMHLKDEVVTVLKGSVVIGFENMTHKSEKSTFTVGGFYVNPAKVRHYLLVGRKG